LRCHRHDQVVTEGEIPWPKRIEMASDSGDQVDAIAVDSTAVSEGRLEDTFVSRRIYQDGGWRAEFRSQDTAVEPVPLTVFSADGVAQGVWCPPGTWTIRWIYQPRGHRGAVIVWICGWLMLLVASIWSVTRAKHGPFSRVRELERAK